MRSISCQSRTLDRMALGLLGLLVVVGFVSFEAITSSHRHLQDGVVHAHDHLAAGPHHHRGGSVPANPSEDPSSPEPEDDDIYLGQAAFPLLDETNAGLLTSYPATASGRFGAVSAAVPSLNQSASPASPRGPPELRLFLTLS
jgi:hypothetical protein